MAIRTILDYLKDQHIVFLKQLRSLEFDACDPDVQVKHLKLRVTDFTCALDRHAEIEEKFLFPEFEKRMLETADPLISRDLFKEGLVQYEHEDMAKLESVLNSIKSSIEEVDIREGIKQYVSILRLHIEKEELILFPVIGSLVEEERLAELGELVE